MKQIEDYIKIYKSWVSKDMCQSILAQLENARWEQHYFYNDQGKYINVSGDKELDISYPNLIEHDELVKLIWNAIHQYIIKDFRSDVFQGWGGFSIPRFNRYKEDRLMAKHCDHIHDLFDGDRKGIPILSIVGALNDDYKGGEFIMFEDKVIELKQGDILIFPSVFLYPHKVNPIKNGVRNTFVSWVW
jgi:predicted 2-oxoglutarate/Fe(II)-dependent dioxygenase YbiX